MSAHASSTAPRLVFSRSLGDQLAELFCIDEVSQTFVLTVDGIPQSRVSLGDPGALEFDYVRYIARVIDAWAPAGHPLACVHLGAGALTVARYVAVTRPASVQCVVERESELLEAVLRELPLPREAGGGAAGRPDVRFLYGDARTVAENAPESSGWGTASADVTVIDLWSGAVIAARVASLEFYRLVARRVSSDGVVAVNLLDGPGFAYTRGQVATLREVFAEVAVVLDERMLGNALLGNVVVLASNRPGAFTAARDWFAEGVGSAGASTDAAEGPGAEEPGAEGAGAEGPGAEGPGAEGVVARRTARVPHVIDDELQRWLGDAAVVTDTTASDSPPPVESHFNEHRGRPFFA
ncbi:MAG: spermine synthase [Subtercola sp.]|nr:spermine synthase [Subtercola sp.]